jgi:hypothetical protein
MADYHSARKYMHWLLHSQYPGISSYSSKRFPIVGKRTSHRIKNTNTRHSELSNHTTLLHFTNINTLVLISGVWFGVAGMRGGWLGERYLFGCLLGGRGSAIGLGVI